MPKVTLLQPPYKDYTIYYGKGGFRFEGGKAKEVPVAVALLCKKKKTAKGDPLFSVAKMPEIVSVKKDKSSVPSSEEIVADISARTMSLL